MARRVSYTYFDEQLNLVIHELFHLVKKTHIILCLPFKFFLQLHSPVTELHKSVLFQTQLQLKLQFVP